LKYEHPYYIKLQISEIVFKFVLPKKQGCNLDKNGINIMARKYPRFIFSHPVDTSSKERFIIHTLYPQMIAQVNYLEDGGHQINHLKSFVETSKDDESEIAYRMYDWYTHIRMQEAKLSFDFFDRVSDIARKLSSYDVFYSGMVSISIVYIPVIGAKFDIRKDDWSLTLNFENNDTFNSTVSRLKDLYREKYQKEPEWGL
jgi:hypothetical protein